MNKYLVGIGPRNLVFQNAQGGSNNDPASRAHVITQRYPGNEPITMPKVNEKVVKVRLPGTKISFPDS